jgi:hypothetical protein
MASCRSLCAWALVLAVCVVNSASDPPASPSAQLLRPPAAACDVQQFQQLLDVLAAAQNRQRVITEECTLRLRHSIPVGAEGVRHPNPLNLLLLAIAALGLVGATARARWARGAHDRQIGQLRAQLAHYEQHWEALLDEGLHWQQKAAEVQRLCEQQAQLAAAAAAAKASEDAVRSPSKDQSADQASR